MVGVKNGIKQVFRILIVSAALRAALMAELAAPTGSARPDLFFA